MDYKTNTKIKNVLLTIISVPMAIIMVSEVQNPDYWWVPFVAAIVLLVTIKVALGGNNGNIIHQRTRVWEHKRTWAKANRGAYQNRRNTTM